MGVRKNCVAVNKKSPLWRPVAPVWPQSGRGRGVYPETAEGPGGAKTYLLVGQA